MGRPARMTDITSCQMDFALSRSVSDYRNCENGIGYFIKKPFRAIGSQLISFNIRRTPHVPDQEGTGHLEHNRTMQAGHRIVHFLRCQSIFIAALAATSLIGCTTVPIHLSQAPRVTKAPMLSEVIERQQALISLQPSCCPLSLLDPDRATIASSAGTLVGATEILSEGRHIAYDCAGITRAVFLQYGIDLYESAIEEPGANGVRLIYNHLRQYGTLHQEPIPSPGDLVFFDNTWDFNGDGELNDPLTHVGIVEQTDPDGTVTFISRVSGGIERSRMNLDYPNVHKTADGRILNDYIRRKLPGDPPDAGRLTGELFFTYGARLPS